MPRLFLIDGWLADAKGHNFQYALDVCSAAERRGYQPILGVRRALSNDIRFPSSWRIERVFDYGECPRHWIGLDGRNPHPCDLEGVWLPDSNVHWWQRITDIAAKQDRRRRILRYSRSCEQLFAAAKPNADDLLFLPSMSEFDFLCAVRYWRDQPWTTKFDWHIQFHFNFFLGRDPEFAEQPAVLRRFQQQFRAAVDQIPEHRLHFYATTDAVARQFDSLGIAIFHPLPYPVRRLREPDRKNTPPISHPLRVTFAGGMRQEKGKKQLQTVIDSLADDYLETGKLQLVFQASPKTIEQRLPKRLRGRFEIKSSDSSSSSPLMSAPHPLNAEKYNQLIRASDIGLFAYDGRRYFSRVSGVLCEMLSAGIPVIVPAGCWLSDQISEESYRQVDFLWRQWNREGSIHSVDSTGEQVLQLNKSSHHTLLVRCRWPADTVPGTYLEVAVECSGADVAPNRAREILGNRREGAIGAAFQLPPGTTRAKVAIRNAYDSRKLAIPRMEVMQFDSARRESLPISRVGLIAADEREMPRLMREMITHYDHYRRTAQEFSTEWQQLHSPDATIAILESRVVVAAGFGSAA